MIEDFTPTQSTITFTVQHAYTENLRIFKPPPIRCEAFVDLRPKQRAIFLLHLTGFKAKEISQLFKVTVFTVYYHIARSYSKYPTALRFKNY